MDQIDPVGLSNNQSKILLLTLSLLFLLSGCSLFHAEPQAAHETGGSETTPVSTTQGTSQNDRVPNSTSIPLAAAPAPSLEWFLSTIDPRPATGPFPSLVISSAGDPYVAYLDDTNDDLKIAENDGGQWNTKSVTPSAKRQDGWYPSLAFDRKGQLHVSYYSPSEKQIRFGSLTNGGSWRFETVAKDVNITDTSLVIGSNNAPNIVFFDAKKDTIRYAQKKAEGWTISNIAPADPASHTFPAAIDQSDRVYVAFRGKSGGLYLAAENGNAWRIEAVDEDARAGIDPSLAIDRTGKPYISYYDQLARDLKYAFWDGTYWHIEVADSTRNAGRFSSIAIDTLGNAQISYFDAGNHVLKYAIRKEGTWLLYTVDNIGKIGRYSSLALDKNNNPLISYFDGNSKILMVAFADVYKTGKGLPARLSAFYHSGQTFITWRERTDLQGETYRIYRSNQPISVNTLSRAKLLAQVGEDSARFWANYYSDNGKWLPRLSQNMIFKNGGPSLGKGEGGFVWTLSLNDFGGQISGNGYYAVTFTEKNETTEKLLGEGGVGPVKEAVSDPDPVEVTTSPGILAEPGAHYFVQYMDLRHWNPTFHAPNATNQYYGQNPDDPRLKDALAYAYDYYLFEPTPDLCGGKIPEQLPVVVFLHGHRTNRYTRIVKYPYPYCAYGLYPIDETETWYFGFARSHDYRTDTPVATGDVIENYTEQRILRMVSNLIRRPPGPAVDAQRIYLFGHSMGGTGALAFAERYPDLFTGIYSGEPVTQFRATAGYKDSWPKDVAPKWGSAELNLPIAISAPNHWADRLQKYNGTGVYDWENLIGAFDPKAIPDRSGDEMVPFGVDHGTADDVVLFATQGQPLYPLLNASPRVWAGAITTARHQWSDFGWPLPNLAKVNKVPFWNLKMIRDETVPGFSNLTGNAVSPSSEPTTYHQTVLWSASWNPWDGPPVDTEKNWQMSFCTVAAGSQKCENGGVLKVDITPRRLQIFSVIPGHTYHWENRLARDNSLLASGTVTAGADGLITIRQIQILPGGIRLRIFP